MGHGPVGSRGEAGGSGEEGLGLGAADMEAGCGPHRDIKARQGAVNARHGGTSVVKQGMQGSTATAGLGDADGVEAN